MAAERMAFALMDSNKSDVHPAGCKDDAFSMGILALRVLVIEHVSNRRRIRTVQVRWTIQVKGTLFLRP